MDTQLPDSGYFLPLYTLEKAGDVITIHTDHREQRSVIYEDLQVTNDISYNNGTSLTNTLDAISATISSGVPPIALTLGEDMTAGAGEGMVFIGTGITPTLSPTNSTTGNDLNFGEDGNPAQIGIQFTTPDTDAKASLLSSITIWLKKVGNPNDALEFVLMAEDKTTVIASYDAQVLSSGSMTKDYRSYTIDLENTPITPDTTYNFIIKRTG